MQTMRLNKILLVSFLVLAVAVPAAAQSVSLNFSIGRWPSGTHWAPVFSLDRDVTYSYTLRATRWGRQSLSGELDITRLGSSMVRLSYSVGNESGTVVAPYDPQAMVGALLLDALTNTSIDYAGLQLLATPFKFTPWIEQFSEASFRNGRVWEVSGHPPVRFDAQSKGRRSSNEWEGELRQGSTTLLLLEIDLTQPLPTYVESRDDDYRYIAELRVGRSQTRILR